MEVVTEVSLGDGEISVEKTKVNFDEIVMKLEVIQENLDKRVKELKPSKTAKQQQQKDYTEDISSLKTLVKAQTQLLEEMKENMRGLFAALNQIYQTQVETLKQANNIGNNEKTVKAARKDITFSAKK